MRMEIDSSTETHENELIHHSGFGFGVGSKKKMSYDNRIVASCAKWVAYQLTQAERMRQMMLNHWIPYEELKNMTTEDFLNKI